MFLLFLISALIMLKFITDTAFSSITQNLVILYTIGWGEKLLLNRNYLYIFFYLALSISVISVFFSIRETYRQNYFVARLYLINALASSIVLLAALLKIINLNSIKPVEFPFYAKYIALPFFSSVIISFAVIPLVIKIAKKFQFMDDPITHKHPGMLIKKPTPRAGGLAFLLAVFIPALFLLPIFESQKLFGVFLGCAICVIIGLLDDRKDINPLIRLGGQFLAALIVTLSGILLVYIPNPFGNAIKLDEYKFVIDYMGEHKVFYVSVIATVLWIVTTMNFLSWSNGTDGVYAGLITVSCLVMSILMLKFYDIDENLKTFIILSALCSGAGLGMAFFTWPPQKLLWGFGATGAALMIAALSIIGSTKVATMLIVLIIPFLDGIFAIVRRLRRGQLPFWGDREHLHHKLLEGLGWTKGQVALFYWTTTIIFGIVGLITSGQARALSLLSLSIILIVFILFLNFAGNKIKKIKEQNN